MEMDCQSFRVRGLTNLVENLTAGSIYLARLTNRCWYRVTKQEMEQDKVEVFCIDTGVTKKVETKYIQFLEKNNLQH